MKSMLVNILLVALGGGLGGMVRFWLSGVVGRRYGETFPWGTLVVNVSGAACIGILGGRLLTPEAQATGPSSLWVVLVVGGLGSYTTVSSFSLQTLALLRTGEPMRAVLNVGLSVGLCLSAATLGYAAAGWM